MPRIVIVGLTTLPPSMSRLSRQCGILNISQSYMPQRPITGTVLLFASSRRAFVSWNFERCTTAMSANTEVIANECNSWSAVPVSGRVGPLAQAAAPKYTVLGAHIHDDHHIRGGWATSLPRLYTDF
jgi:hypothetical protein